MATNLQNKQINVFPRRNAGSYMIVSEATINILRDRVGKQRRASTKPWEEAASAACLSSGDAPVKRQQIGQKDEPVVYVNLAEWGAPHQRDGLKKPPS